MCLGARLLPQSYQYPNLLEGADHVGGQLRWDKECPFSGITKSGSLEEGAGKRCLECGQYPETQVTHRYRFISLHCLIYCITWHQPEPNRKKNTSSLALLIVMKFKKKIKKATQQYFTQFLVLFVKYPPPHPPKKNTHTHTPWWFESCENLTARAAILYHANLCQWHHEQDWFGWQNYPTCCEPTFLPFFLWTEQTKRGCAQWSSNLKQKKYTFCMNSDGKTKWTHNPFAAPPVNLSGWKVHAYMPAHRIISSPITNLFSILSILTEIPIFASNAKKVGKALMV